MARACGGGQLGTVPCLVYAGVPSSISEELRRRSRAAAAACKRKDVSPLRPWPGIRPDFKRVCLACLAGGKRMHGTTPQGLTPDCLLLQTRPLGWHAGPQHP
jgi:hypothetical protein